MQLTNIFFTLLLSTAVAAKGNKTTKAVTDNSLCKEMASLEKTVALAANTTKLDAKAKGNTTKIAEFQAKASDAATTLATMQTNTTLVSTCAVIAAAEDTKDACSKMASLEKLVSIAANTTKVEKETKGNATKAAALQSKASAAAVKLADMQTNTTLTSACASIKSAKEATKDSKAAAAASSSATAAAASATASSNSAASMLNAQTGIISTIVMVAAGMMML